MGRLGLSAAVSIVGSALLLPVGTAHATITIPSGTCAGTLQACIDGAAAGETIEIATNTAFDESITIRKSLTLTSATGFVGSIGNEDGSATTRIIDIGDNVAVTPMTVTLRDLVLSNARIDVGLFALAAGGHQVAVSDCQLFFNINHNNTAGVDVDVRVPATVDIRRNTINSSGQPIRLFTLLMTGVATLTADANFISTQTPEDSSAGVEVDIRGGGTVTTTIVNNVMDGVAGCFCGGAAGIPINTQGTVESTVNIVNNTIDGIDNGANAINVRNPTDTSQLTLNVFNNIVTRAAGAALHLPTVTPQLVFNNDFNDFFFNGRDDVLGGYTLGAHTLSVDPRYVGNGDLRLRPESPLLNAGTDDVPGGLPADDADGNPRVSGGTVDVGAFERVFPAPTVTGVDPTSGPTTGGTALTITGTGFIAAATVTVGGAAATNVVVVDATTITTTTPAGSEGAADVVVSNPGGLAGTLSDGFTYVLVLPFDQLKLVVISPDAASSVQMSTRFTVATGRVFDPGADGITLELTAPGGTPVVRTIPGASLTVNRRRTRFRFSDPTGTQAGGITKLVLRFRGSGVLMQTHANALPLEAGGATSLTVGVASGASRFGRDATCASRARGRKLVCR
jgi:hypothetical protein